MKIGLVKTYAQYTVRLVNLEFIQVPQQQFAASRITVSFNLFPKSVLNPIE
jgi:hypothetical protein